MPRITQGLNGENRSLQAELSRRGALGSCQALPVGGQAGASARISRHVLAACDSVDVHVRAGILPEEK